MVTVEGVKKARSARDLIDHVAAFRSDLLAALPVFTSAGSRMPMPFVGLPFLMTFNDIGYQTILHRPSYWHVIR